MSSRTVNGDKVALQVCHKYDADEQEKASTLRFECYDISEFSRVLLFGICLESWDFESYIFA